LAIGQARLAEHAPFRKYHRPGQNGEQQEQRHDGLRQGSGPFHQLPDTELQKDAARLGYEQPVSFQYASNSIIIWPADAGVKNRTGCICFYYDAPANWIDGGGDKK
jgi:hypothetical protein